jgi:hypothetical protein
MVSFAQCVEAQLEKKSDLDFGMIDSDPERTKSSHGNKHNNCKVVARMGILLSRTAGWIGKYLD